jgi:hypothetical protein
VLSPPPRPPPAAARRAARKVRKARYLRRQDAGLAVYQIEARVNALAEALIRSGRLSEAEALRRSRVEGALGEIVDDFVVRWNAYPSGSS